MYLSDGFLLGVANTASCLGVCAPLLFPYLLSEERKTLLPLLYFLAGRLAAYLLFALCAGWAGIYLGGHIDYRIYAVLMVVLSLWMIVFAFGRFTAGTHLCGWISRSFSGRSFPFAAGFVLGLNLCPPFLLGLARALEMRSLTGPVVFFTGFYIGSSAWMAPLLFSGALTRSKTVRVIGQIAALAAGLWYLGKGVSLLIRMYG